MTTRAEHLEQVLRWEQVAAEANRRAQEHRLALSTEAREEFAQGTAPTWRMALGTVTLPVSKPTVRVSDEAAWTKFVKRVAPSEIVESVRPASAKALLGKVQVDEDLLVWPATGEVVQGVTLSPGGEAKSLTIRPDPAAAAAAAVEAKALLDAIALALGEPAGGDEVPE